MDRRDFDSIVEPNTGRPHKITVTPRFGEHITVHTAATALRNAVTFYAARYTRRTRIQELQDVEGILILQNHEGNSVRSITHENVFISAVDGAYMDFMIETIAQSGRHLTIYDFEFIFLINPASITRGAGRVKRPAWAANIKYIKTWEQWFDDEGPITCAAIAITFLLSKASDNFRTLPKKVKRLARALQTEMGWGASVRHDELETFVKKYPTKKIVIYLHIQKQTMNYYTGKDYVYNGSENILYIGYDIQQQHYAAAGIPTTYSRSAHNSQSWCHGCSKFYSVSAGHECVFKKVMRQPPRPYECGKCGNNSKEHKCALYECKTCRKMCKKGGEEIHRCAVIVDIRKEDANDFLKEGDIPDGKKKAIISYDLESKFVSVPIPMMMPQFGVDEDGYFREEIGLFEQLHHVANMVCFQVCFHKDLKKTFYGDNCIKEFLYYIHEFNNGNNILIAHNSSGYDCRLLFRAMQEFTDGKTIEPLMRGTKFLQLKLNKLVFRDSLLHLPASLKSLGKEMAPELAVKGFFPYLFNIDANQTYSGPIPDLKYFATSFKTKEDMEDLKKWHSEYTGLYNFRVELEKYCVSDVSILARIIEVYNTAQIKITGLSPWLNVTAPSAVNHAFMEDMTKKMEIENVEIGSDEYNNKIQHAVENGFAVLKDYEYYFCMAALRGGRTENRRFHLTIPQEDIDRGCRLKYIDVVSLYPSMMLLHKFPVGLPTMYFWDQEYAPCVNDRHHKSLKCDCDGVHRFHKLPVEGKCVSMVGQPQPTKEQILGDDDFNGFFCVTLIAPKDLIHPVLVTKSVERNKCVASLADEDNTEVPCTGPELKEALRAGYELVKIHRFDKYKFTEPLWADIMRKALLEKMRNSGNEPATVEGKQKIVAEHAKFEMEDMIRESWGTWVLCG